MLLSPENPPVMNSIYYPEFCFCLSAKNYVMIYVYPIKTILELQASGTFTLDLPPSSNFHTCKYNTVTSVCPGLVQLGKGF